MEDVLTKKQKSTFSGELERRLLRNILRLGTPISMIFLGLGIVLLFYSPVQEIHTLSLGQIFEAMFQFRSEGFINFGLLILLATPVAGVVGAIIGFVVTRDWPYAGVTLAVFLVLLISIFIGSH